MMNMNEMMKKKRKLDSDVESQRPAGGSMVRGGGQNQYLVSKERRKNMGLRSCRTSISN